MKAFAKKTFLALKNPYHTVEHVYPNVIDEVEPTLEKYGYAYYTGYKQTEAIPQSLIQRLETCGFLTHTRDKMSLGGRAVDMQLINPLTGKPMTGSSSGTALNVFYRMNDLGVGTDGGGSVLAPAAALNLYGFLSPLLEKEAMKKFQKISTDGISFSPSLGFISRDRETLDRAVSGLLSLDLSGESKALATEVKEGIDIYGARGELISYLTETVKSGMVLLSREGPVDLHGMGDTVFGHFDPGTQVMQRSSGKGLMRVANMCGLSAVTIPGRELGVCTVLLCSSSLPDIREMLLLAKKYEVAADEMTERYFGNLNMYFEA